MAQMNNILRYFAVYYNGVGYMGEASEVKLPDFKVKREEFRGGGMDMPVYVDLGMDPMEFEFKLFSYDNMVYQRFALMGPFARTPLTLRGYLEGQHGASQAVKINMDVRGHEITFDNWKAGQRSEVTVRGCIDYLEWFQNERLWLKFDPLGFQRVINGVDQLVEARVALGLIAGAN
jgi:P2 family phage contractile tail tube protein